MNTEQTGSLPELELLVLAMQDRDFVTTSTSVELDASCCNQLVRSRTTTMRSGSDQGGSKVVGAIRYFRAIPGECFALPELGSRVNWRLATD
jgi:hypothetical protein